MTQYAILTDLNRCVGCMSCMVSCKVINGVPIGSYWNKMLRIGPYKRKDYKTSNDVDMYYLCVQCQHCENPKCVEVCPTGASHKMPDGTVQIDKAKCIGCQFCAMACPYNVRYLNEEERVVEKMHAVRAAYLARRLAPVRCAMRRPRPLLRRFGQGYRQFRGPAQRL